MAYQMKGSPFARNYGIGAPAKQKQVPLSEHEKKKGTIITGGSKSEVINDLEDRIEFLESDIKDKGQLGPTKTRAQLMKLKEALKKAQNEKVGMKQWYKEEEEETKRINP
tara:strand:- start:165 stop:494 length:330 start_codon:yes stop_codon:yes gene_type:complete